MRDNNVYIWTRAEILDLARKRGGGGPVVVQENKLDLVLALVGAALSGQGIRKYR